jgi:hypothetical protein
LREDYKKMELENSQLKIEYGGMKTSYESACRVKKELRKKIREIKKNYQQVLQKVEDRGLSVALVSYKNQEEVENNALVNHSLQNNFLLLAEKVVELRKKDPVFSAANDEKEEHVCPKVCSEAYHQQIKLEQEKQIISQINTDCRLGCEVDSSLNQLISRIKELISSPSGENLTVIVQLEKETMKGLLSSHLFTTYSQQLSQITNYQQLVAYRSEIIKAQLAQNQQTAISPAKNCLVDTKTVLTGSLIFTFLMAGALILKNRKGKRLGLEKANS